jgi:hypothetical protein
MNNENNPQVAVIDLGSITADGDVYGAYFPKKSKILGVKLVNGANVTADNTNYFQLSLKVGTTEYAEMDSRAAHENGVTANELKSLNIATDDEIPAGSLAKISYNEEGTMALTSAKVFIHYFPL